MLNARLLLQSGEQVTRLDELQDIDELHVIEVRCASLICASANYCQLLWPSCNIACSLALQLSGSPAHPGCVQVSRPLHSILLLPPSCPDILVADTSQRAAPPRIHMAPAWAHDLTSRVQAKPPPPVVAASVAQGNGSTSVMDTRPGSGAHGSLASTLAIPYPTSPVTPMLELSSTEQGLAESLPASSVAVHRP